MKRFSLFLSACLLASVCVAQDPQATLTSDELELKNNGTLTIFRGNVVLTQAPYEVRAERMTRTQSTGHVQATGRVVGTWVSPKKERVRLESDEALYDPAKQIVEFWGKKQVSVFLKSEKDQALFHGDRGWMSTRTPGKARLVGHVRGHITPGL
jgi:lipopolysaccharide transport protein LptA